MAKPVQMFRTFDGHYFEDEATALRHETIVKSKVELREYFARECVRDISNAAFIEFLIENAAAIHPWIYRLAYPSNPDAQEGN